MTGGCASCWPTGGAVGDSWVAQYATLMAVLWPLALIAVFAPSRRGGTSP